MLLPTREQWKNWSLPSKYTAIGLLIGIIALGATFLVPLVSQPSTNNTNQVTISGEFFADDTGDYEINYGVTFKEKPQVIFYKEKDGYKSFYGIQVEDQRLNGVSVRVNSLVIGGESFKWTAIGRIAD